MRERLRDMLLWRSRPVIVLTRGPAEPVASPAPAPASSPARTGDLPRDLLACCLTPRERALLRLLHDQGERSTLAQLRDLAEADGSRLAEGWLKACFARLTEVGILDNDRRARPPGYRLTARGAALLAALD